MPDQPLLRLDGVSAGYGDLVAVRDVSLAVSQGEVLALLGRNGAGKTTLLQAISGLCRQHAGIVSFDGKDVGSLATSARMALGMGLVQEGKRVFRQRTVEENLVLGGHAARLKGRDLETALEEAYTRFSILRDRRAALAGALSGGQQQMLAIATALMSKPRLLMLDEPSAGLAPSIVSDISDVVKGLRESGLTVLLVEQSVEFALDAADRVVVLDLGRTVFADDASRPDVRSAIRSAYMGGASGAAGSAGKV